MQHLNTVEDLVGILKKDPNNMPTVLSKFKVTTFAELNSILQLTTNIKPKDLLKVINVDFVRLAFQKLLSGERNAEDAKIKLDLFIKEQSSSTKSFKYLMISMLDQFIGPLDDDFNGQKHNEGLGLFPGKSKVHEAAEALRDCLLNNEPLESLGTHLDILTRQGGQGAEGELSDYFSLYKYLNNKTVIPVPKERSYESDLKNSDTVIQALQLKNYRSPEGRYYLRMCFPLNFFLIGNDDVGKKAFIENQENKYRVFKTADLFEACYQVKLGNNETLQYGCRIKSMPKENRDAGVDGAVILFDMTNRQSFNDIATWVKKFRRGTADTRPIVLVGTNSDASKRVVSENEIVKLAKELGISYLPGDGADPQHAKQSFAALIYKAVLHTHSVQAMQAQERARAVALRFLERFTLQGLRPARGNS